MTIDLFFIAWLVVALLGCVVLYWIIRLAVRHGIRDTEPAEESNSQT